MAQRTITECDRCKREISSRSGVHKMVYNSYEKLLCKDCGAAFVHFMSNEDQVGKSVFKLVDGPCPHYVPCAGPCTSVWELVPRG